MPVELRRDDVEGPRSRHGLSEEEAAARLQSDGFNELPRQGHRTLARVVIDVMREPMLALLVVAGLIYLALGDVHEALVLIAFAGLSILITVIQESRTERALEALRDLTSPRALVIRDGRHKRIAGREVVRGDLVIVTEGDRIPADGWMIDSDNLSVDESLLTGESVAVRKATGCAEIPGILPRPGGDDLPGVYSGSLVVSGNGLYVVTATGPRSEIGKIGQVLSTIEIEAPRLQIQTRRLVFWFATLGGAASILATLLYGFFRGGWLDAALAGIALGMSMLPEEFPVVLTVFMAMGATRISRAHVLTRHATAIEALGSATTLCTDKTGTLTENRMRVAELRLADGRVARSDGTSPLLLEQAFHRLAEFAILASEPQPVDPMDVACHELAGQHQPGALRGRQHDEWTVTHHYGVSSDLLANSHVWSSRGVVPENVVASKGAPEAIAELCAMGTEERADLEKAVDAMAAAGLRVLGVAAATWSGDVVPSSQRGFSFAFCGLIGLADPLRASVPDAVRQCRSAGIRIVMITGDYPQTACAIARQAGIDSEEVLTGDAITRMSDAELERSIASVSIFARIMPEQKLRIVNALKSNGEIVAMTGDGVNDAPSLKAAHIGVAMGNRGTDVAREASAIVLLDDDFGSIVKAVRLGRRIYDNLRKAMGFIVAVHIPIAGLALLPLIFGLPLLLGPIHIAFLEMIIDPVCSLAFEAETEEQDVMQRPPRAPDTPLFSRSLVEWSAVQGIVALLLTAGLALFFWTDGRGEAVVRTIVFFSLVLNIIGLILINRTFGATLVRSARQPNIALAVVVAIVAVVLAATQWIPSVADIFRFERVESGDLLWIVLCGATTLALLELLKPFWRNKLIA